MVLPPVKDKKELITYPRSGDSPIFEAVVDAFEAGGIDVYEKETTISDWTKGCPINSVDFESDTLCWMCTIIWEHPVVLTAEEIRIFEKE